MKEDTSVAHLVDYLERNLKKGYKIEDLRWALISQKHSRIEIDKAIKIIQVRTPVKKPEPMQIENVEIVHESVAAPEKKGFWARLFGRD